MNIVTGLSHLDGRFPTQGTLNHNTKSHGHVDVALGSGWQSLFWLRDGFCRSVALVLFCLCKKRHRTRIPIIAIGSRAITMAMVVNQAVIPIHITSGMTHVGLHCTCKPTYTIVRALRAGVQ